MSNPQIHNTFKDQATGLHFLIPASHQLSTTKAAAIASQWIQQKKNDLLVRWKAKKANEGWMGDDTAKAEELFAEFLALRPAAPEILLTPAPADME